MKARVVGVSIFIIGLILLSAILYRMVSKLEEQVETNSRWYGEAIWQISQTERALQNLRVAIVSGDDFDFLGQIYLGQGNVLPRMPVFDHLRFGVSEIEQFRIMIVQMEHELAGRNRELILKRVEEQLQLLMQLSVRFAVRNDISPDLFKSQRSVYRYWVAGLLGLLIMALFSSVVFYNQVQRLQAKKKEARRLHFEKIGLFAAGIVHELNTRLSALRWAFDRAVLGDPKTEAKNAYALIDHMAALTDRMLLLARGGTHLQMEEIDLEEFMANELDIFQRIVGDRIQIDASQMTGFVQFDRICLKSILTEALANARDAMEGHGVVQIAFKENRLTVTDSGHGITIEDVDKYFEPSFTTKGTAGTGLGLAVIENIVTAAEGAVSLSPSTRGYGAVLAIDFKKKEAIR